MKVSVPVDLYFSCCLLLSDSSAMTVICVNGIIQTFFSVLQVLIQLLNLPTEQKKVDVINFTWRNNHLKIRQLKWYFMKTLRKSTLWCACALELLLKLRAVTINQRFNNLIPGLSRPKELLKFMQMRIFNQYNGVDALSNAQSWR